MFNGINGPGGAGTPGPLQGKKIATGIIYLDDNAGTNEWKLLNTGGHESLNIDSVTTGANGVAVIDYTTLGLTKVITGLIGPGGQTFVEGLLPDYSMGLTSTTVSFKIPKIYETDFYLNYNGSTWVPTKLNAWQPGPNPTLGSWDAGTGILVVNHGYYGNSCTNMQAYPLVNGTFMVQSGTQGFAYNSTTFYITDYTGAVYAPVTGDRVFFRRAGYWINPVLAAAPNSVISPSNILTGGLYYVQVSNLRDLDSYTGGTYNNFQIMIIGE